jgi:hypothetical protein
VVEQPGFWWIALQWCRLRICVISLKTGITNEYCKKLSFLLPHEVNRKPSTVRIRYPDARYPENFDIRPYQIQLLYKVRLRIYMLWYPDKITGFWSSGYQISGNSQKSQFDNQIRLDIGVWLYCLKSQREKMLVMTINETIKKQ